jgi:hypothetical protein
MKNLLFIILLLFSVSIFSQEIGDTKEELLKELGQPDMIDVDDYNSHLYTYFGEEDITIYFLKNNVVESIMITYDLSFYDFLFHYFYVELEYIIFSQDERKIEFVSYYANKKILLDTFTFDDDITVARIIITKMF